MASSHTCGAPWRGWLESWPPVRLTEHFYNKSFPAWGSQHSETSHISAHYFKKQVRKPNTFYDLVSEVSKCHFCHIFLVSAVTTPPRYKGSRYRPPPYHNEIIVKELIYIATEIPYKKISNIFSTKRTSRFPLSDPPDIKWSGMTRWFGATWNINSEKNDRVWELKLERKLSVIVGGELLSSFFAEKRRINKYNMRILIEKLRRDLNL